MKKDLFEKAFEECSQIQLKFENAARYNTGLKFTFRRTFDDVSMLGSGLSILEVGAFTGVVSVALSRSGHKVTATDVDFVVNDPGVEKLFSEEGIKSYAVDLTPCALPFSDGAFDLIIFNEVLEHLNFNPIPLLREFHRVLSPEGRVYCATPNLLSAKNVARIICRKGFLNPPSDLVCSLKPGTGMTVGLHWREWSKEELVDLFECADFLCEWHRFGLVTPNCSKFPRNAAVRCMYKMFPGLMPNQAALFRKSLR